MRKPVSPKKNTPNKVKLNPRTSKKASPMPSKTLLFEAGKFIGLRLFIIVGIVLLASAVYLDLKISKQFEGQKWALPAHVYTRPMELYLGQQIDRQLILDELDELGYQAREQVDQIGTFKAPQNSLTIYQREFQFWDQFRPAQLLKIDFSGRQISNLTVNQEATEIVRLEPRLFGSVSPLSHEDRKLLLLEEVPQSLIDALISIEDQQFYSHFGINPFGILRATWRNIMAGRVVQGGSTLTQQLVKNYYLNSQRTFKRKITEMIMAILLEMHYSKDEILQAYINEVYLSQAGNRAIHGFALGSEYFFGRPLQELSLSEIATLVGMIKGPSYYSPVKHPERAKQRRDLVLQKMLELKKIDLDQYQQAIVSQFKVSGNISKIVGLSYPSFLGFVRENLTNDYHQDDLLNDGLQIYTTLNPRIQKSLEQAVQREITVIEKSRRLQEGQLQVAAVTIRTDNGEVVAMVGDRQASFAGYNRALQAKRPVGSLLKPFVYLTALEQPQQYSLATSIADEPIVVSQRGSKDWRPQNYDKRAHGDVMLIDALAHSYNFATVRLGMQVGVPNVVNTMQRLGLDEDIAPLPSLLLGAVEMSVMQVGQLYLSIASGGFKTPIKSIRSVLSNDNEQLSRYPLTVEQVIEPEFNTLISYALQEVVRSGTARSVVLHFDNYYGLAGKTGTTDGYRDSWFAGFSGNYLTVVWLGRDNNKSTGLTGASGAARVWSAAMSKMPLQVLELSFNEPINYHLVQSSYDVEQGDCSYRRQVPILQDSLPVTNTPCGQRIDYSRNDATIQQREREVNPERKKSWWEKLFGN